MNVKNGILVSLASIGVAGSLLISSVAFADTTATTPTASQWGKGIHAMGRMMGRAPGIFGTVASLSPLTVTTKAGPNGTPASVTYTVDASSATVTKAGAASAVSAIVVGDTVMVQGTVTPASGTTGASVVAKTIRDGIPAKGAGMFGKGKGSENASTSAPIITGNGQPVIGGTVSAVSGNTITITTAQGGLTYNVDATSATVQKAGAALSISSISLGDKLVVQGTVNGTSVTATSVVDQGAGISGKPSIQGSPEGNEGFMSGIRGFFQHLFGFF